ncbi:MAG: hypothetical protein JWN12_426 [Candidatus Saccharibacteria bacterium]|nr:hypothetical protein [Candidatus Saccharibacteria bacterium]
MKNSILNFFKIYKAPLIVFFVAGSLGALIFIAIFGVGVINPTYVQWIQADNGDLSQHYIGWLFYRNSPWSPTLGSISSLAYPHGLALTFTDSIPLFAIPFKLLSPLLPSTFQYFGLWGVFSYAMMGGIGGLILRQLTKNVPFAILGSLVFSMSPIVIQRMFSHTALAGHWVILAGIFLLVRFSKASRLPIFITWWSVVLILATCVHPYFLPMAFALLLMSAVLTFKKPKDLILRVVIPFFAAVCVFAWIGGFVVTDVVTDGARDFGLNVNTLINSMGWSDFLQSPKELKNGYEAFAYLGLGMILLAGVALYTLISTAPKFSKKKVVTRIKSFIHSRMLIVCLIGLAVLIAAVSPTLNIGTYQFAFYLPNHIERIWSIFRATGRLFWPLYYLLVVGLLYVIYKKLRPKVSLAVLLVFFVLFIGVQTWDIYESPNTQAKHVRFIDEKVTYETHVDEAKWASLAKNKNHIQYIGGVDTKAFFSIAYFATDHGLTMSDGYYARSPQKAIDKASLQAKGDILSGHARSDTIYITKDQTVLDYAANASNLSIIEDQGSNIIVVKE